MHLRGYKSFVKGMNLLILANFLAHGSRSAFPNTDPDPGEPNQCGYGTTTLVSTDQFFISLKINRYDKKIESVSPKLL
jgi:hypothetical protein